MACIQKLPGTSTSNIDFLTAHVTYLLSNAKNNFLARGCILQMFKIIKVVGTRTNGVYLRSFDRFHKCITATELVVRSVQLMDIETVH